MDYKTLKRDTIEQIRQNPVSFLYAMFGLGGVFDENLPSSPGRDLLGNAGNSGNVFLQLLCAAGIALLASDVAVHNRALKEKRPRVFRVLTNVREVCGVALVAAIAGLVAWYISDTLIQWVTGAHEKFSQSISQYCKGAC